MGRLNIGKSQSEHKVKSGIAIIGVGRWGVHLVRNFQQHPQACIVGIVDHHQERLAYCRQHLNLDETVLMATDWESVRKLPDLDAVVVVTPAYLHYPLILDALQLGYHVLSEKPLALNPTECLELTILAEQQQKQLFVDHTYLFHPAVEKGQKVIQSGKLGQLRYGYATRTHLGPVRHDVDALWDLAIHDICIFNHWLGKFPIQVQASGNVWLQHQSPMSPIGLSDLVWVTLIYPGGFRAYIHLCWLNPDKQRRLCMVGSQGTLIFDEMSQEKPLSIQHGYFERQGKQFIPTGQSYEVVEIESGEPLAKMCDRFLNSIHTNTISPLSSGLVGTKLVQILSCLSQSLQQGGMMVDVP